MRETFLMILLVVVSNSAAADWIKLGSVPTNGGFDFYADPATAVKAQDLAKMWTLSDFKIEQTRSSGFRYLSARSQYEFDCKIGRSRVIALVTYSGNMASGVSVDSGMSTREWKPVMPGGIEETSLKLACGRL
jgi:hypothetical protein